MTVAEPENRAKPDWWCPICEHRHGSDYEAAKACVALGEPDGAGAAPRIAAWQHDRTDRFGRTTVGGNGTLEIVSLGGVKRVRIDDDDDGRRFEHVRTYENGLPASVGVGYVEGTLVEVGGDRREFGSFMYGASSLHGLFSELIGRAGRYKSAEELGGALDIELPSSWETYYPWVGRITDEVTAALDVLMPTSWSRVRDREARQRPIEHGPDRGQLPTWVGWYKSRHHSGAGWTVPGKGHVALIAQTHGFAPWDEAGMSRWEFANREAIAAGMHDLYRRWVDGEDVTVPLPSIGLSITQPGWSKGDLPRKPNKKRVEALASWGVPPADDDRWWNKVLAAVWASITTTQPAEPLIPGVPNAIEFSSTMSQEARP